MAIRIYGIRNCDTMKKAFAWLESHKVGYDFHDYKKAGVPPGKLKEWATGPKLLIGFDAAELEKLA